MKFPLPGDTFPEVTLSPPDALEFENLSAVLLKELMEQYRDFTATQNEVVSQDRWRQAARRENVTVYKERRKSGNSKKPSGGLPLVMAVGSLDGDLDDVMYGVINHSKELMRTRSSYLDDRMVDCNVLATIIQPSKADPMRSLTLKWLVKRLPFIVGPIVRFRDFVYIESTGILVAPSGQRIGYHIQHSVDVPGIRELHELNIVRANLSTCALYPERRRPGDVELYVKSFMDPCGGVPANVALGFTASAVLSSWKNIRCAQMKKLNWLLNNTTSTVRQRQREVCSVCERSIARAFCVKRSCRICLSKVCSRCHVKKKLNFISPFEVSILKKDLSFCTRCLYTINQTSALQIALDEVSEGGGDSRKHKHRGYQDSDYTGASRHWNSKNSVSSPRSDGSVSLLEMSNYSNDKSHNHILYYGNSSDAKSTRPSSVKSMPTISTAPPPATTRMSLPNAVRP